MYGIRQREAWEVDLDNYLKKEEEAEELMEGLRGEFNSHDFTKYEKLCEEIHPDLVEIFKEALDKEFEEYYEDKDLDEASRFDYRKIIDNCFQSDTFLDAVEELKGEDYFDTPEWDDFCETVDSYIYGNPVKKLDDKSYSEPEI